jgi:hypothetical protein
MREPVDHHAPVARGAQREALLGALQEDLRHHPPRVGQQYLAAAVDEAGEERAQGVDVAPLVEHVGREHQVPWRALEQRGGVRPVAPQRLERRAAAGRVALGHAYGVGRPVGCQDAPAGERGGDARQAQAAAQLQGARAPQRAAGDVARERHSAWPQLGPVGQVLLVLERFLVEQPLAVARPQHAQLAACEGDDLLDEILVGFPRAHGNQPTR